MQVVVLNPKVLLVAGQTLKMALTNQVNLDCQKDLDDLVDYPGTLRVATNQNLEADLDHYCHFPPNFLRSYLYQRSQEAVAYLDHFVPNHAPGTGASCVDQPGEVHSLARDPPRVPCDACASRNMQ